MIQYVDDRLGHDCRYSLDTTKTRKLGWKPQWIFEDEMEKTINWYKENSERLYKNTEK